MSISGFTPKDLDIPSQINPLEYFNADKIATNFPSLINKKIIEIIDAYPKLKSHAQKKEQEAKTLYEYNRKLLTTIEEFMEHEKNIVTKYNKLCEMFQKNIKQYASSKSLELNFNIFNPTKPVLDSFSMKDWKFQIETLPILQIDHKYEESLLTIFRKYYFNSSDMRKMLQATLNTINDRQSKQGESDWISKQIKEVQEIEISTSNMFDVLDKWKTIEQYIKQLDDGYSIDFINKDNKFADQVGRLHSFFNDPPLDKLKEYVEIQAQARRELKKKQKKQRLNLQAYFQSLQNENIIIKEEISELKTKLSLIQTEKNEYRQKFQILQLRSGVVNSSKKEKGNNSNASIVEEYEIKTSDNVRQNNKELKLKVSEMQVLMAKLKQDLLQKQEESKNLSLRKEIMNSTPETNQLRLKLCSKLMELRVYNTEEMTSGQMFDRILQLIIGNKQYQAQDMINEYDGQESPVFKVSTLKPSFVSEQEFNEKNAQEMKKMPSVKVTQISQPNNNLLTGIHDKQEALEYIADKQQSSDSEVYKGLKEASNDEHQSLEIHGEMSPKERKSFHTNKLKQIQENKSQEEDSRLQNRSNKSSLRKNNSIHSDDPLIVDSEKKMKQDNNQELRMKIATLQENQRSFNNIKYILQSKIQTLTSKIQEMEQMRKTGETRQIGYTLQRNKAQAVMMMDSKDELYKTLSKKLEGIDQQGVFQVMISINQIVDSIKQSHNMNKMPNLGRSGLELFQTGNIALSHRQGETNKKQDKILRLNLNSGEINEKIKMQKSIYFDNRQRQTNQKGKTQKAQKTKLHDIQRLQQSTNRFNEELIQMVNDFGNASYRQVESNNQLSDIFKLSTSNNVRYQPANDDLCLRSEIKFIENKYDRRLVQDYTFLNKLQAKIEEIKNHSDQGSDLYCIYKRYKQTLQALQKTENIIREHELQKQNCVKKLIEEDPKLSKNKLYEKISYLQQKVSSLQEQIQIQKDRYEQSNNEQIKEMDEMRDAAFAQLLQGVIAANYDLH